MSRICGYDGCTLDLDSLEGKACCCMDASNLYCQGCGSNPADRVPGYPVYCTPTCDVQCHREPKART